MKNGGREGGEEEGIEKVREKGLESGGGIVVPLESKEYTSSFMKHSSHALQSFHHKH